jgi:choline kinase
MKDLRVIVLAAGEGLQLDGFTKALIRHPETGESVIEQYLRLFAGYELSVVVGYRAIELMHRYPRLHYVYNHNWRLTGNAYSLALALDERPALVLSSDLFMADAIAQRLLNGPENVVLTRARENRPQNGLNLRLNGDGTLAKVYRGTPERPHDPEAPGVFKISDPTLLRLWKRSASDNGNLFALETLPLDREPLHTVDVGGDFFHEVNSPTDYLALIEATRR